MHILSLSIYLHNSFDNYRYNLQLTSHRYLTDTHTHISPTHLPGEAPRGRRPLDRRPSGYYCSILSSIMLHCSIQYIILYHIVHGGDNLYNLSTGVGTPQAAVGTLQAGHPQPPPPGGGGDNCQNRSTGVGTPQAGVPRWNRNPRPQPKKVSKLVSIITCSQSNVFLN